MSLRWGRVLPLALFVAGVAGGIGAWVDYRRAPPRSADSQDLGGPLNSPETSQGTRRDLDQETAKAVIIGLRGLTEMRLRAAPARHEAMTLLLQIQAATQANLYNFGVSAMELPLCPTGPLSAKGNPWSTGCRQAWEVLGWIPRGSPMDGELPAVLCRYMIQPDAQGDMQAFALCDEYSDGELEVYQVGPIGPVLALDEPEFSPPWARRNGNGLALDKPALEKPALERE